MNYEYDVYNLFGMFLSGRKHVVFGKVTRGMEVVKKIEQVGSADGKPLQPVKIVDCGETSERRIEDAAVVEKSKSATLKGTFAFVLPQFASFCGIVRFSYFQFVIEFS